MNPLRASLLTIFLLVIGVATASAQLKSRAEMAEDKVQEEYNERRKQGLTVLTSAYAMQLEQLVKNYTRKGDLVTAQYLAAELKKVKAELEELAEAAKFESSDLSREIVIQALIDGQDVLHVTAEGIYWESKASAKPGRHEGQDLPTYVNGIAWKPRWDDDREDRGADTSSVFALKASPEKLKFELLGVGLDQDPTSIENRSPITSQYVEQEKELKIFIPDGQGGSRWYKFRLYYPN